MSPRTVFSPYLRLFAAVPGARAFSFAGWLARLPMPILGLGACGLWAVRHGTFPPQVPDPSPAAARPSRTSRR